MNGDTGIGIEKYRSALKHTNWHKDTQTHTPSPHSKSVHRLQSGGRAHARSIHEGRRQWHLRLRQLLHWDECLRQRKRGGRHQSHFRVVRATATTHNAEHREGDGAQKHQSPDKTVSAAMVPATSAVVLVVIVAVITRLVLITATATAVTMRSMHASAPAAIGTIGADAALRGRLVAVELLPRLATGPIDFAVAIDAIHEATVAFEVDAHRECVDNRASQLAEALIPHLNVNGHAAGRVDRDASAARVEAAQGASGGRNGGGCGGNRGGTDRHMGWGVGGEDVSKTLKNNKNARVLCCNI